MLVAALLQVADNGKGISPEDHAALALKYHTSKINQFNDLQVREPVKFPERPGML